MKRARPKGRAIGITGGIACGKSEVGRVLARHGIPVLDADDVAHRLLAKGSMVARRVVRAFGPGIRGPDGTVDRRRLGAIVFADPAARARLNALVHPPVLRETARWRRAAVRRHRAAAVIVPLLFEAGATDGWDAIVCVASRRAEVMARLRGRGLGAAEAVRRIRAQWPLRRKMKESDYVIWNRGTLRDLERETLRVLHNVLKKESEHHA